MSLLAETIVDEWLNRQGYFTIRGIKLGNDEIDLLAVRPNKDGIIECRHIEVQASVRPISYISQVPKQVQKMTGRGPNSAKRNEEELAKGVAEWVEKKFRKANKREVMQKLVDSEWTSELVIHNVKDKKEVELIRSHGIKVRELADIIKDLRKTTLLLNRPRQRIYLISCTSILVI